MDGYCQDNSIFRKVWMRIRQDIDDKYLAITLVSSTDSPTAIQSSDGNITGAAQKSDDSENSVIETEGNEVTLVDSEVQLECFGIENENVSSATDRSDSTSSFQTIYKEHQRLSFNSVSRVQILGTDPSMRRKVCTSICIDSLRILKESHSGRRLKFLNHGRLEIAQYTTTESCRDTGLEGRSCCELKMIEGTKCNGSNEAVMKTQGKSSYVTTIDDFADLERRTSSSFSTKIKNSDQNLNHSRKSRWIAYLILFLICTALQYSISFYLFSNDNTRISIK